MQPRSLTLMALSTLVAAALPVRAFDVNDQLSVNGILAVTGQCQNVSARLPAESYGGELLDETGEPQPDPATGAPMLDDTLDPYDNECRGGIPFQLEVSYHPNDQNELFLKLGFAAGNGLNEVSPWNLAPWAADLEEDVKDINGRNRDYLLAAWYKHTFIFQNESTLGATFGILDATAYVDDNAFANDEYTQFSNEVFVNSGSYGLPSYDAGAALELAFGPWSINAIGMNVGENDDGNNFNFWGMQATYRVNTALGIGNYRIVLAGTSPEFPDPTETSMESLFAGGISFDQEFGDVVGAFLRFAWEKEDASVDYKSIYSGGLNFSGNGWGRDEDNIGIGYAYLGGGNTSIDSSQVFETYYRAVLNHYAAITADVQFMKDDITKVDARQKNPEGWIFGLRLTAEF